MLVPSASFTTLNERRTDSNASTGPVIQSLTRLDMLGMFAGCLLCIVICCVFTQGRIFWEDEMLGWMLIHDPSWSHMVSSWKMGADGGGFLFYFLGRGWFRMFGASDLSFRLTSAVSFALAFCLTWLAARRFYNITPVAFGLFNTWFFSPPMVMHMAEGRFYGLLVLTTSLVVWLVLSRCKVNTFGPVRTPVWLFAVMFLSNAMLTTSHVLGILYSGVLLAALVLLDRHAGRLRTGLYFSGALSWLLLIPEKQAILNSAKVGKPWFWTVPPDAIRFLGGLTGFSTEILIVEVILLALLALSLSRSKAGARSEVKGALAQRRPVYYVTAALLSVPFGLAIGARFGTSLFINRYLLPVNVALAFAAMEAFTLIQWHRILPNRKLLPLQGQHRWAGIGLFCVALLIWVFWHMKPYTLGAPNYTTSLSSQLPKSVPVVFEDAWGFTETIGREHDSGVHYTYMLDWQYVISPSAPKLEVTQFHLMQNWKDVGYFAGSIRDREEFLSKNTMFIVLRRPVSARDRNGIIIGNPLAERFSKTPGYEVRKLARMKKTDFEAWLVCKRSCTR